MCVHSMNIPLKRYSILKLLKTQPNIDIDMVYNNTLFYRGTTKQKRYASDNTTFSKWQEKISMEIAHCALSNS